MSSIQPSNPNINIALTKYYNLKTNVGFATEAPPSIFEEAKGGREPRVADVAPRTKVRFRTAGLITLELPTQSDLDRSIQS